MGNSLSISIISRAKMELSSKIKNPLKRNLLYKVQSMVEKSIHEYKKIQSLVYNFHQIFQSKNCLMFII